MKTNKLLWAAMLPLAFAACSQEEIVENPSASIEEAVAQYKGAQLIENPSFSITKGDEGVNSRMSTTNGVVDWETGDKVGLVWLNAEAIAANYGQMGELSDLYPTSKLHFSNTRITHGENSVFSMQDGQLYAGQYLAYHPYDENMKQVGQFSLKQSDVQNQSTSAVVKGDDAVYDYLAKNMNWLSRSANNNSGKSSFLYHIDANKAGLVKTIHIPMRRYSNIFESRFVGVEPSVSLVKWEDLTIQKVELIADSAVFAKEVAFDFSKGIDNAKYELARNEDGEYIEIPATEFDKDGNPIANYQKDASGYPAKFVVGLQQVGPTASYPALIDDDKEEWYENKDYVNTITLNINKPVAVGSNSETQQAMFLLLPTTAAAAKEIESLSIKITTDYGYVIIPESAWKAYVGKDPDPVVNGTNWGSQDMFQDYAGLAEAGKTATNLLSLIGQKITRFVSVNPDDLVYNNIYVSDMDELTEALKKWNDLGEEGEFTVIVEDENNFADFDWSVNSSNEEIKRFLADKDVLNVTGAEMNLSGTTTLNDPVHDANCTGHLDIEVAVNQVDGEMNVVADEAITDVEIYAGATLNVEEDVLLNGKKATLSGTSNINGMMDYNYVYQYGQANVDGELEANYLYNKESGVMEISHTGVVTAINSFNNKGNVNIAENGLINAQTKISNSGLIVTDGIIKTPEFTNGATGVYRIKTHSDTQVDNFTNKGKIYYDEQGKKFAYTNVEDGKSIATIKKGDDTNTLANYIINANKFKCTDLVINPNDNLTTTQWDNSLNETKFGFKTVTMNDGVVIQFNKNLTMSNATVEIPVDATVTWKKGSTINEPVFKISQLVVYSGSTLNVSGIRVENAKVTSVDFGNEGKTVTINGMGCFKEKGASKVNDASNGTIVTTE